MRKCVFFDRDGVVNAEPVGDRYVKRWKEFHILPGFVASLRTARTRGYEAVVVTNQKGIALGLVSRETVEDIHARLRALLSDEYGLELLDILYCPHDDGECECRKPLPGMLRTAADRHGIDLSSSWMVGDRERDVEAGRRAGCRTVLVSTVGNATCADVRVADMDELQARIGALLDPVDD